MSVEYKILLIVIFYLLFYILVKYNLYFDIWDLIISSQKSKLATCAIYICRIIFSFSLYTIFLLVVLVVYFRKNIQNINILVKKSTGK